MTSTSNSVPPMSTGSTLVPESFDFVYDAIKNDVQLSSASGGTDIHDQYLGNGHVLRLNSPYASKEVIIELLKIRGF